ncbi:MAG: hypothetical protein IKP95_08860 [Ruminococcus sp.]|nr:hypothetical protein [Ruminococcus sp.]
MADLSAMKAINDLSTDIVIEEEAFSKAANDFMELCNMIDGLLNDVREMLNTLHTGFDTPAGHKFMSLCEDKLLEPIEQQKIVITHIADNLTRAKTMYQSVFDEYREVTNAFNS